MPDDDSKLTAEQKEMAVAWLNERGAGDPTCPGCGKKNWEVGEHLVSPPIQSKRGLILGGLAYPNFMIICSNCGNTQYFNAVMAKLVESNKEKEEKSKDTERDGSVVNG